MGKDTVRFLHLSDTHFGVHYALKPRNHLRRAYGELFFRKVEEVIRRAISIHKIDFIIHSGDFFNRSKPPHEVVDRGVKPFNLLPERGFPFLLSQGIMREADFLSVYSPLLSKTSTILLIHVLTFLRKMDYPSK